MSQSGEGEDFEVNEFGSEIPTGKEAESLVREKVQEFQEQLGRPETDTDDSQDRPTGDSDRSTHSQGDTLTEQSTNSEQRTTGDSRQCKNSTSSDAALSYPWDGCQHELDYTRFWRIVAENTKSNWPTRLSEGVKSVYSDDYTMAEYQRLRRLVNRRDWFKVTDTSGFKQIEATPEGLKTDSLLRQQYEYPQNNRRNGDRQSTVRGKSETTGGRLSKTPKERVQSFFDSYKRVESDEIKLGLFGEFVTWRENIEGTYSVFRQHRGRATTNKEYLLFEYPSRFKDRQEADKSFSRLTTALHKATEGERRGVMVTLTPDPKRFENHTEIVEAIQENLSRFIEWTVYQLGHRPEYLKILEFQKNGLPHYHIVLFGVQVVEGVQETETGQPTLCKAEVQSYWDERRDVGREVEIQPVVRRNDVWILHEDEHGTVGLDYYLGEAIRELGELTDTDTDELRDMVAAEDTRLWRQVLYWAYGKQYLSRSNGLKETNDGATSDDIKRWDYIGTAELNQLPSYVTEDAIIARG